jgi:Skp family chaperone for outer membrane proteins
MRVVISFVALVLALSVPPAFAQAPAPTQQPPTQPQPAPAQPAPAQPAPAQPATPQPATPQPPAPFPQGAKVAYVNLPLVAQNSTQGKSASAKIDELQKRKQAELQDKNKQLQAAQQKLNQSGTVLNDQARGQLEKEVERMQREIQFAQQSAQAEVQDLTQDLQEEFRKALMPIINEIGKERDLHLIFSLGDAGMIWGNPGLDITPDVIRRLDTAKPAAK